MCQADHAFQGRNQRHCNPRYMYVAVGPQAEKSRTDTGPLVLGLAQECSVGLGAPNT